jgi:hypothetical protein
MADNNQPMSKQTDPLNTAGRQGAEAVRQGAQAAQKSAQAARDAVRRVGDVTAEATQRAGEAGASAIRRGGDAASETVRRNAETFAESQREFLQNTTQQFEAVSRKLAEVAQSNTENLRTLMTLPNTARGGLQDLQQGVAGLVEGVVRTNLRATQELFQLANPAAFVELQQRFVREYLNTLMQGTVEVVRATRRTADETLRPLEQQIEKRRQAANQGQHYNQGQRYQYAAE